MSYSTNIISYSAVLLGIMPCKACERKRSRVKYGHSHLTDKYHLHAIN